MMWILILTVWSYGYMPPVIQQGYSSTGGTYRSGMGVATEEFSSHAKCLKAADLWIGKATDGRSALCVPK
jgi:hypothetical protein